MKTKYKGVICVVLSALCFACMGVFVRLSGDLPSVEKGFFRNLIAAIAALCILIKSKEGFKVEEGNFKFILLRALFGTIAIFCNYYALDRVPLADASILNKMSPFFAVLFCFLILKEKVKPAQITIITVAFIGSMFVVKPSFDFVVFAPYLCGLCGGVSAGIAHAFVRLLGTRKQKGITIVFSFSAISCLVMLPLMIINFEPIAFNQLCWLLLAGVAAAGGQFFITTAYCHAPAREVSVFEYTQIIFSTLLGIGIFDQVPDAISVLGYIIICSMAFLMFNYNKKVAEVPPETNAAVDITKC